MEFGILFTSQPNPDEEPYTARRRRHLDRRTVTVVNGTIDLTGAHQPWAR
jgi:hypothetical protein